jgi:hypothetical protein
MDLQAELGDAPDLRRLFTIRSPTGDSAGGATEPPHDRTLPAQTERTYTRRNVPQDRGSQAQQMLASMNGVNLGGAENGQGP